MNFYVEACPMVSDTEIGCVVDFGIRKTFFSKSGLRMYNETLQTATIVAFSCDASGENTIFFREGEFDEIVDGVQIANGFSITYSDSMKPSPRKKGIFFRVKFGSLRYWSSDMFVPIKYDTATITEAILIEIAEEVKNMVKQQLKVALHRNKIETTIKSLVSYEDLDIPEHMYWLSVAHLLLYRPQDTLYKNFVKELTSIIENVKETPEVTVSPSQAIEQLEQSYE